ncbi:MAG TPA: polymorphic toxin-type HINT domain-containing protein [Planctomycetaceae bacterium]|nr:polymorphic toxin-type HINT domain-containing protein [Planctomycetaceae bacterium]
MTALQLTMFGGMMALVPALTFAASAEKADGVVQAVLAREATADVPDRGALLAGVLTQSPKLSSAQWSAGRISVDGAWLPIADRVHESAADAMLAEYRTLREQSDLTPARHRELAAWCGQHNLRDQERAHLWALLSENANQPELWKRLGYHNVDGQWLTTDEERDLERLWQQRQRDLKRWQPKAENFARRLSDPNPTTQANAREQLRNLDDVAALPALETTLCTQSPELALEFVAWAKRLDRVETTHALARQAIVSPWEGSRELAVDSLRTRRLFDSMPVLLEPLSTHIQRASTTQAMNRWGGGLMYRQVFRREFQNAVLVGVNEHWVRVSTRNPQLPPSGIDKIVTVDGLRSTQFNRATQERVKNDLARSATDAETRSVDALAVANRAIDDINARCQRALTAVTGDTDAHRPEDWWSLWDRLQAVDPPGTKPVVEVVEVQEQQLIVETTPLIEITEIIRPRTSCLPAGTRVHTELGPKPIETIQIGDRVLAKDIDTGELAYRPVLRTTVRSPQPLVKLSFRDETIQATRGHHFWVSGQGWRMARELRPGDRLHGLHGTASLTDTATGDVAAVYNLVVDRANTYFVGDALVLSHDVTSPAPTNVKVPGLTVR